MTELFFYHYVGLLFYVPSRVFQSYRNVQRANLDILYKYALALSAEHYIQ